MWKRVTALTTAVCLLVGSCAPHTIQLIEHQEMLDNPGYRIAAVITKSGEYLEFEPDAVLKDSMIVGKIADGPSVSMALSSVDSIYVLKKEELDEEAKQVRYRTIGCIIGGSLLLGGIIAISLVIANMVRQLYE